MRTRHLVALVAIGAIAFAEATVLHTVDIHVPADTPSIATVTGKAEPGASQPPKTYDVAPLLRPAKKYLGVTVDGGVNTPAIDSFAKQIGKKPNLVAVFESFNDGFAASEVRKVYEYGGLAMIRWEPKGVPMADLAAGKYDQYVVTFAKAVRKLNLPIALTFGHEMNGNWYTWGTKSTTPAQFVAAWRHVHDIFVAQQATNVLWTWTPNVVTYLKQVKLAPLYPGDDYVDWLGLDGYYSQHGPKTYTDLFAPTIAEVRAITKKPILIVETGMEPGTARPGQIENLLTSVADSADVIGCAYFNLNATKDWKLDDSASQRAFAKQAGADVFGFDVGTIK
ncbi:glycosyl hydrolase [Dactylosporangium sp. NPDC051484]|uniref:glycoside hydrolase family 26 protein n=1 Tax=Dactylosporangium sp. NPDC051484 TaxID=3154942 RepID=UPI0034504741